ncbi:hypothetical protein D3C85_1608500 [compost metagenome]
MFWKEIGKTSFKRDLHVRTLAMYGGRFTAPYQGFRGKLQPPPAKASHAARRSEKVKSCFLVPARLFFGRFEARKVRDVAHRDDFRRAVSKAHAE